MQCMNSFRYTSKLTHLCRCIFQQPLLSQSPDARHFTKNSSFLKSDEYTKEQRGYILDVINKSGGQDLPSKLIGESNARKISCFLDKIGSVERLEDLLKVQGLGPRTLRKICDRILEAKDGPRRAEEDGAEDKIVSSKKRTRSISNFVEPRLSPQEISNLSKLTSIHLGTKTVSWALLDCKRKELLEWNTAEIPLEEQKNSLITLLETAKFVKSCLPEAEVYVMEEGGWGSSTAGLQHQQGSGGAGLQLCRAQLTAMLLALISCGGGEGKTVLVKSRLTGQMFNTVVGSERVSCQAAVEEVLELGASGASGARSSLIVGPAARAGYLQSRPGLHRENLASALLLALAFLDAVVYQRVDLARPPSSHTKATSPHHL